MLDESLQPTVTYPKDSDLERVLLEFESSDNNVGTVFFGPKNAYKLTVEKFNLDSDGRLHSPSCDCDSHKLIE